MTGASAQRDSEDLAILRALGVLESKLTTIINTGLDNLQTSIAQLRDAHMASQLEQAKLNATFANRDTVETMARRVDAGQGEVVQLHMAITALTKDQTHLRKALDDLETEVEKRHINLLTDGMGWLVTGGFTIAGALLSYVLFHH